MILNKRKSGLITILLMSLFVTETKAQTILAIATFLKDLNYINFVGMYAAVMWPLMEPYAAAFSVGPAQQ